LNTVEKTHCNCSLNAKKISKLHYKEVMGNSPSGLTKKDADALYQSKGDYQAAGDYQPKGNYVLTPALDSTNNRVSTINSTIGSLNTTIGNLIIGFNGITNTVGALVTSTTNLNTSVNNLNTIATNLNTSVTNLNTSVTNLNTSYNTLSTKTLWCATGDFCQVPNGKGLQLGDYTIGINSNRLCIKRSTTGNMYCFDGINFTTPSTPSLAPGKDSGP